MWNAGVSGAAQPFLQIDLGSDMAVSRLELSVAQYPDGYAVHQFIGYTQQWVSVDLGTFSGYTYNGMLLTHHATNPTPVRWVRIITLYNASWVAWNEVKAYRYVPNGTVSASPTQCTMSYQASFCDPVTLSASIFTGEYGRVWVAEAPPGAPELGGWVFDTLGGSAAVGWIRPGTYRFELREGAGSSGAVISSVSVTAQKLPPSQPPPPPPPAKKFGYFATWTAWLPQTATHPAETSNHTNLVWVQPGPTGITGLKSILGQMSADAQLVLDGTDILFGEATCQTPAGLVKRVSAYFDEQCTPQYHSQLRSARQRYEYLIRQLTLAEYQKIGWVFPVDEPDLYTAYLTDAQMAEARKVIIEVGKQYFPSVAPPKLGLLYSYRAVPMTGTASPVGAASADAVAFNCYPLSYGSPNPPSGCGEAGEYPPILERFERLKALVPGKKYFLVAESGIPAGINNEQSRGVLVANLMELRRKAQSDSSVEGIIAFNWRGLNPTNDDGASRLGARDMFGGTVDFGAAITQEGRCLIQKGPCY